MELHRQKVKASRRTPTQLSYQAWHRAFDRSQSAWCREHFIAVVVAEWQKQNAMEVAKEASLF